MGHAIAKRATRHGEIKIKLSIARIFGIERHAKESLFARSAGETRLDVKKRLRPYFSSLKVENENLPSLLNNE